MGDHMLQRRPVDAVAATKFATALLLGGVTKLRTYVEELASPNRGGADRGGP